MCLCVCVLYLIYIYLTYLLALSLSLSLFLSLSLAAARVTMLETPIVGMNGLGGRRVSISADQSKKVASAPNMKLLKMQLAIKCADVSHPFRPLELHLEWSRRICEEFFMQGDLERNRNVKLRYINLYIYIIYIYISY